MRRHDVGQLLACLAVLVWVSGCSFTDAPSNENRPTVSRPAPSTAQPSAAQRPVYDPPRNFTANRGVAVGPGEAVVGREREHLHAGRYEGTGLVAPVEEEGWLGVGTGRHEPPEARRRSGEGGRGEEPDDRVPSGVPGG